MKKLFSLLATIVFFASLACAQSTPPRIFYSDLTSGPQFGGQSNAGAFVTIYGTGFGSTRGSSTVTIGGGAAASYPIWSNTKVTFQLGGTAKTGNIVINVGGAASNTVPFTIAPGCHIYFVSTTGTSRSSGSYTSPWSSLATAVSNMVPGDIVYVENGVSVTSTLSNSLVLSRAGTSTMPKAIVAYPGATVTVGSASGANTGIDIISSYWVLSQLTIRGAESALVVSGATGTRVTSSDISCPNGNGPGSCVSTTTSSSIEFLGNYVHNNGLATAGDLEAYHSIVFNGANSVELGWNQIGPTLGCNGVVFTSSGALQYSLSIHDNYIHDTPCEAVDLSTVNPASGAVNVYNNIITNSGTGPLPSGAALGYGYAAIAVGGGSSAPAQVYNNTIYNAGAMGGGNAGAFRILGGVQLTNNLIDQPSTSDQYVSLDSNLNYLAGSYNLFYGAGNPLSIFTNSVTANPNFVNLSGNNYHLAAGSPAIDAGTTVNLATDFDGVARPQGSAFDIGAYEYPASTTTSQPQASATASLSASGLSFASQSVNTTSAAQTLTLSNTGTGPLSISSVAATGNFAAASGCGTSLAAGSSCIINVTFTPTATGTLSGTLTVTDNASPTTQTASLSGTGAAAAAPAASLSASSLGYGSYTVNTTSAAQTVTLSNTGNAALAISSIAATGNFAQTNTCGSSLAAGSTCSINMTFTPTAAGTLSGTLTVTDNASPTTQTASLTGTGAAAAGGVLQVATTTMTWGYVNLGTSTSQVVNIGNAGSASLTISSITSSQPAFTLSGVTLPVTLAPNTSVNLTITFTPTADVNYNGTVTVTSSGSNQSATITTIGAGTGTAASSAPAATLSTTGLTFISQTVNTTSAVQTVTLTNGGTAALAISSIAAPANFAQTNTCGSSLAAGSSCTISVTFTPTATGTLTGTLTITDNASPTTQTVSLTGTGAAAAASAPVASLSASGLNFSSQTVSTTSAALPVTLSNTGSTALSVTSIAASANFAQTNNCGSSLAAGSSCTINVTFTPTATGTLSGSLTVTDNAGSSTQTVSLSGTGAAASSGSGGTASVTLSWTGSTAAVSYNVYRSTMSGAGYTLLTSGPVTTTSYLDTAVTAGTTYYYVTTAVGSNGAQSAYSAPVTAVVPAS